MRQLLKMLILLEDKVRCSHEVRLLAAERLTGYADHPHHLYVLARQQSPTSA